MIRDDTVQIARLHRQMLDEYARDNNLHTDTEALAWVLETFFAPTKYPELVTAGNAAAREARQKVRDAMKGDSTL